MAKTMESDNEKLCFPLELENSQKKGSSEFEERKRILTKLSSLIMEAYKNPLSIYSDKKIEQGPSKGYNERELIANMLTFILYERDLHNAWIKLYRDKKIGFREGGEELQALNGPDFRMANTGGLAYVWRDPNIYDFYLQAKKIGKKHSNYGLVLVRLGINALENHTNDEIREKYRATFLN
jgi:hypothetical protein